MIIGKVLKIIPTFLIIIVFLFFIEYANYSLAQEEPQDVTQPLADQFSPIEEAETSQQEVIEATNSPDENINENDNKKIENTNENPEEKNKKFLPDGFIKFRQDNTLSIVIDKSVEEDENKEHLPYTFYIIPENCIKDENQKSIMLYKVECQDLIELSINGKGSYDFSILSDSHIYGSRCTKDNQNCVEESDIEISFISEEKLEKKNDEGIFDLNDFNALDDE